MYLVYRLLYRCSWKSDNRLMCYYPQRQPNRFNRIKKKGWVQVWRQDFSDRELPMI